AAVDQIQSQQLAADGGPDLRRFARARDAGFHRARRARGAVFVAREASPELQSTVSPVTRSYAAKSRITRPGWPLPLIGPRSSTTRTPLTHTPCRPTAGVSTRFAPPGRSHTRRLSPRPTVAGSNRIRSAQEPGVTRPRSLIR